ncbi:MAG TPA: hypothetical protein GXZ39_13210 [Bacteroidales bacterium]|nr:hypothetical protein [Bacteroidales bacterium]
MVANRIEFIFLITACLITGCEPGANRYAHEEIKRDKNGLVESAKYWNESNLDREHVFFSKEGAVVEEQLIRDIGYHMTKEFDFELGVTEYVGTRFAFDDSSYMSFKMEAGSEYISEYLTLAGDSVDEEKSMYLYLSEEDEGYRLNLLTKEVARFELIFFKQTLHTPLDTLSYNYTKNIFLTKDEVASGVGLAFVYKRFYGSNSEELFELHEIPVFVPFKLEMQERFGISHILAGNR